MAARDNQRGCAGRGSGAVKSNELYLADIVERMRRVRESAASGRDAFFSSTEKQDAILHNLQLLGESVPR